MIHILEIAAEAGKMGTLTAHAIRSGWSLETIFLYARMAASQANMAIEFSADFKRKS